MKNSHPELKVALEHYGFLFSQLVQIELCPSLRNYGINFLSVGNTLRSVSADVLGGLICL